MRRGGLGTSACCAVAMLAGCSLAPDYKVPPTAPTPAQFKEAGNWSRATPEDHLTRGNWWTVFGDETLNGLETELDQSNPNLQVALAHYDEARAFLAEAQASLFPSIGLDFNPTQNQQSLNRPLRSASQPNFYAADTFAGSISYELDLWGSVRNTVAASAAQAEAEAALLASAKLSLEAQLAQAYFNLRGLDAQDAILDDTIKAYARAYRMTEDRHAGGIASGLDVGRAKTQLGDAQAEAAQDQGQRALYEHAIASFTGRPAPDVSIAPAVQETPIPNVPAGVPSTLVERRPDVAAAERGVFAANADIGVARAAFFPNLTLSGLGGFQNTGPLNSLFTSPNLFWTVGPSLAMTVFEGGERRAALRAAKAADSAAAGTYRATVLQAFQDVEDNLALLNHLANAATAQAEAVDAAIRTEDLALARYELGAVDYLQVVTAQTAALEAKQSAATIETNRLVAAVHLIQAIGGGWTRADLPALASADPKSTG